ncbi:MAG: tyrosine-type recombinase/integrase [Planctomycetota bacterium]
MVADLSTDGLDASGRSIRLHGKGDKTRIVPLGEAAAKALSEWLHQGRRRLLRGRSSNVVFLGPTTKAITRGTIWRLVRRYARTRRHHHPLSPHTCATPSYPHDRKRRRPTRRAGNARPRLHPHHRDLHPPRL